MPSSRARASSGARRMSAVARANMASSWLQRRRARTGPSERGPHRRAQARREGVDRLPRQVRGSAVVGHGDDDAQRWSSAGCGARWARSGTPCGSWRVATGDAGEVALAEGHLVRHSQVRVEESLGLPALEEAERVRRLEILAQEVPRGNRRRGGWPR